MKIEAIIEKITTKGPGKDGIPSGVVQIGFIPTTERVTNLLAHQGEPVTMEIERRQLSFGSGDGET